MFTLMWKGTTPSNTLCEATCKVSCCTIELGSAVVREAEYGVVITVLTGVPPLPGEYLGSHKLGTSRASTHTSHAKSECKTQHNHTNMVLLWTLI